MNGATIVMLAGADNPRSVSVARALRRDTESDDSARESVTDEPARPFEVRSPAGLGVLVGYIELHERRCGFAPIGLGVIGFEQRGVQREVPAIIFDHVISRRSQCLDHAQLPNLSIMMTSILRGLSLDYGVLFDQWPVESILPGI